MMKSLLPWVMAMATAGWITPCVAQEGPIVSPVMEQSSGRHGADVEAPDKDVITLARMLRARTDLSWLLSPADGERIAPSPEQKTEARVIVALARVARSRGLDRNDTAKSALHTLETAVLAEAARQDLLSTIKVTDADIAIALKARPGWYDEFRLSHIFVAVGELPNGSSRKEAAARLKAERIRKEIDVGGDFAAVAKRESDDTSTSEAGGELSSMFGRYMADEFFPAARLLSTGEVSQPVRGKLGYHILRLDERFPATLASARFLVTEDIRAEKMPTLIAEAIQRSVR